MSRLHAPVTALGPGTRAGVWVHGCTLGCDGCISPDTWGRAGGFDMSVDDVLGWLASLPLDEMTGVTVSGGEPFEQPAALGALLSGVREFAPHLDLLVYSGWALARVEREHPDLLALVDAVITGRYVRTRPTKLIWRGSANQQLVPLSALGRERYTPYVDRVVDRPPMQLTVDDGVRMIGVPQAGSMAELEQALAQRGVHLDGVSWHG